MSNTVYRLFSEKLQSESVSAFIGKKGEIFYDPESGSLRISDGSTPGGIGMSSGGGGGVDPATVYTKGQVDGMFATVVGSANTMGDSLGELQQNFANYMPLNGGAPMTGPLTLFGPPTSNNEATTKTYVDTTISTSISTALTNGTITSNTISFSNTGATGLISNTVSGALKELDTKKVAKAGDTMTGFLTLNAAPTVTLHAATKGYVDTSIATVVSSGSISSNNISYSNTASPNIVANTVSGAIAELDAEKVAKAGDIMTGFLTLYADPIAPLQAATKDYVDGKVVSGSGAKLLDELLDVNASAPVDGQVLIYDGSLSRYVLQNRVKNTGDSMTGFLTLSADPTSGLHAATKQYVDTTDAGKVAKAGDTMTGLLTLSGAPTTNLHAATKLYVDDKVAAVVNSSPATLDTLNELAAALGNDANFATTVATNIGTKVSKAGDTMTGALVLAADPTANLQAATKQYVDGKIANTTITANNITYTPAGNIAANNVTGALTELDTEKVAKAGDTMTGALVLSGAPTIDLHAATKLYVDTASGAKVTKAGDTMTGLLTLSGEPTSNSHAATKLYVDSKTYALDDLSDVSAAAPTSGQVLSYNGTNWVAQTQPVAGDVSSPFAGTSGSLAYFASSTGKIIAQTGGFQFSGNTISVGAGKAISSYQVVTRSSAANGVGLTNASLSWDYSYHKRTIAAATTFAFALPTSQTMVANDAWSMTIELIVSGGSVTWPSSIRWPSGTTPTLTVAKTHLIMLVTSDGGTTVYGSSIRDY